MMNKASIMIGNKDTSDDKILLKGHEFSQDQIDLIEQIDKSNKTPRDEYIPLAKALEKFKDKLTTGISNEQIEEIKKTFSRLEEMFNSFKSVFIETAKMVFNSPEFQSYIQEITKAIKQLEFVSLKYNQKKINSPKYSYRTMFAQPTHEKNTKEEIKPGDYVEIIRPENVNEYPGWIKAMDMLLRGSYCVDRIGTDGTIFLKVNSFYKGLSFNSKWCKKVKDPFYNAQLGEPYQPEEKTMDLSDTIKWDEIPDEFNFAEFDDYGCLRAYAIYPDRPENKIYERPKNKSDEYKPDWSKIPVEYNYVAIDGNGEIWVYIKKPVFIESIKKWRISTGIPFYYYIGDLQKEVISPESMIFRRPE